MSDHESISPGELTYHRHLADRAQWAAAARQEVAKIDGACESWLEHLRGQYRLGPHDRVDDDGTIVREPVSQETIDEHEKQAAAATAKVRRQRAKAATAGANGA